jgi:hypothetical protein
MCLYWQFENLRHLEIALLVLDRKNVQQSPDFAKTSHAF